MLTPTTRFTCEDCIPQRVQGPTTNLRNCDRTVWCSGTINATVIQGSHYSTMTINRLSATEVFRARAITLKPRRKNLRSNQKAQPNPYGRKVQGPDFKDRSNPPWLSTELLFQLCRFRNTPHNVLLSPLVILRCQAS